MKNFLRQITISLSLIFTIQLLAIIETQETPVHIEIVQENETIEPGLPFFLVFSFHLEDKWHTCWNPDDSDMPVTIDWKLPEGFTVKSVSWPKPACFTLDSMVSFGYEKKMELLVELEAPNTLDENSEIPISASLEWLTCSDTMCLPGDATIETLLTVKNDKPKSKNEAYFEELRKNISKNPLSNEEDSTISFVDVQEIQKEIKSYHKESEPTEFENNFALALLFAFMGGILLNLMPCVLPVLSLKVFSFVKLAKTGRINQLKHGAAFSIGVLISFWILAGALLILQAYGKSVGWGFQLQEPAFVAILISILFILGLNLFGIMELGMGITNLAGNVSHKKTGLLSSFFSGILATAVATPCTGPFLGSAVGYAVTLPAYLALLIFTFLGIGMAFPYLILSAFPSLLRFIPKPGNWMITFKEIMGFMMMATTVWLLWVFSAETSSISTVLLIGALLFFAIASWIYGKWGSPLKKKRTRILSYVLGLSFLLLGVITITKATSTSLTNEANETSEIASNWEPFSPQRVEELQAQGIPVFVDFTAKWCLICQVNHMVLTTGHTEDQFKKAGVVRMKADWTKKDPVITEELKKFGRNSVPLYVLYGKEKKPKILPQVLTSDILIDHINELEN